MNNQAELLHLERNGVGSQLVFIHGVGGSSGIWEPILAEVAPSHEIIRIDLLGYGNSPKPPGDYTPERHVKAIRQTLQHHGIRFPVSLVGLSMGGLLALEFARRWPSEVSRILVIGLPYYPNALVAKRQLRHSFTARLTLGWPVIGPLVIRGLWSLGRRSRWFAGLCSGPYTAAMAQETMQTTYAAFESTLKNCLVYNRPGPLLSGAAQIPQYYLHGTADRYTTPKVVRAALNSYPSARLTTLNGVAHNTVILAPNETAKWINSVMSSAT